jgi:hypothetical protein
LGDEDYLRGATDLWGREYNVTEYKPY